jgi:hypothetical protein
MNDKPNWQVARLDDIERRIPLAQLRPEFAAARRLLK